MEPKGVRVACPDCTLSVVMTSETDIPAPVTKVVEGTPYCPNCDQPMKPVASVDVTHEKPSPSPGLGEGLSLAERLDKIRDAEHEVADAESDLNDAKEEAARCKKVFDGRVASLRTMIARLTSVASPVERGPLLDIAEQPAVECRAVRPVDPESQNDDYDYVCTLEVGHEGPHVAQVGDASTVNWPNEAEAMGPDSMEAPDCCAAHPDQAMVCSRTKGHTGPHIAHLIEGLDRGKELARWPQAAEEGTGSPIVDAAAATAAGELQTRCAGFGVMVTLDDIERWTVAEYDQVIAWLEACDATPDRVNLPDMPAFLIVVDADADAPPTEPEPEPEPEPSAPVPIESGRKKRATRKDREPAHA